MINFCSRLLILLSSLLVLSACEEKKTEKDAEIKIGILMYGNNDPYIAKVAANLESEMGKVGKVYIEWAESSQATQNTQFLLMIEKDIDILLANIVEPVIAPRIMDQAKINNIPVVFFDREPDLKRLDKYSNMIYVGTDAKKSGVMQGEMISAIWKNNPQYDRNNDGIMQYIMLRGNSDSVEATARTINSVGRTKELGIEMSQLCETFVCNGDRVLAQDAMRYVMLSHKEDVEFVIANNDNMGLGAIDILQSFGYNIGGTTRQIPVFGVNAIDEALIYIKEGFMSGTVKQDATKMAEVIAITAKNLLDGKNPLAGTDLKWDSSGTALRIDYEVVR